MPEPLKLFISYRSSDAHKVDKIARDLALLKQDDGTPRYIPWQDKHNLPPASPHWWDAIIDAIDASKIFVFHMSREALKSDVCLAELDYAHRRNHPIIPVVLEFDLDVRSGKYHVNDYWSLVPDSLKTRQFLFYIDSEFYMRFQDAVALFEKDWPRLIPVNRPHQPKAEYLSTHALYKTACDYAGRLAFADAETIFRSFVTRRDANYAEVAYEWLTLMGLYEELIDIDDNAPFLFKKKWDAYTALFPKDFLEELFDPKGFANRGDNKFKTPSQPIKPPIEAVPTSHVKKSAPIPVAPSLAESLTAEDYFGRAEKYRLSRDYVRAIADYTEAIHLNPQYARAYNSRANVYLTTRNLVQALADCNSALTIDPQNANIYDSRGDVHAARRHYDAAIADYTQAITLNPQFAIAYVNRGIVYYAKKNYDRAMDDYAEALRLKPNYARAYNNRAYIHLAKGDFDNALSDCNMALKFEYRNANIYDSLGDVYFAKGDYDRAIANYEIALQIDPNVPYAAINHKKAVEAKQVLSDPKGFASKSTALPFTESLTAEDYFGRAEKYRLSRDYVRAIADYAEAIRLNPQYARAYNSRAYVYLAKRNLVQALADCDSALAIDPQNANIYDSRGDVHAARRHYDAAIADYTQAITLNPQFAIAYVNRGIVYYAKKNYDRAMDDYAEALRLKPNYARAYNNRAYIYLAKGDFDNALSDCNRALEIEPRNANIYDSRGDLYFAKGDYDRAIADYEMALKIDPNVPYAAINHKKAVEAKQKHGQ